MEDALVLKYAAPVPRFRARDVDGLSTIENGAFSLTPRGRPFARSVAATFDAHLCSGRGRHSVAV